MIASRGRNFNRQPPSEAEILAQAGRIDNLTATAGRAAFTQLRRWFLVSLVERLFDQRFEAEAPWSPIRCYWRDGQNWLNSARLVILARPRRRRDSPWILRVAVNHCGSGRLDATAVARRLGTTEVEPDWHLELTILPREVTAKLIGWLAGWIVAKTDRIESPPAPYDIICPIESRYVWSPAAKSVYEEFRIRLAEQEARWKAGREER